MVAASWIYDIFGWDKLSYVATVFGLLLTTTIIPTFNLYKKRQIEQKKKDELRAEEIAKKVIEPIIDRLKLNEATNEQLKSSQDECRKSTHDVLSVVRQLSSDFHKYKDDQNKINSKIYFIDGYVRQRQDRESHDLDNRG